MASKLFFVALFVVAVAMASANVLSSSASSADVEKDLSPTLHALDNGQYKLVFKSPDGKDTCSVCSPFEGGCGCSEIVAIRCELKHLKQKLIRLNKISDPHQHASHAQHAHAGQ